MVKNGLYVDIDGNKSWFRDDKRHREDGPAVERYDGSKSWYRDDKLHREDGPAIEYADGKRHREDGPAVEYANGTKEWWVDGILYSFTEWLKLCSLSDHEKIELSLYYG